MTLDPELRAARETLVREHMESENVHDYDATIGTFHHPRYEIIPTGAVHDGEAEVREYFRVSRTAFPDQRNELIAMHHSDDAVIVEFNLLGTHTRPVRRHPPDGQGVHVPDARRSSASTASGLVYERVYFDLLTILAQLGLAPGDNAATSTAPPASAA